MKSHFYLAIACLAIGASVSWIIKPGPESPSAANDSSERNSTSPTDKPRSSATSRREVSDRRGPESDRPEPAIVTRINGETQDSDKVQQQMEAMFKERQMTKWNARILKLVTQLQLSKDQEDTLREVLKKELEVFDGIFSGESDPSRVSALLGVDGLDNALTEILTDSQKDEFEKLKEKELANKVEARALKELANLTDLDLTPDQKDAVYDILYQQAETSIENEAPTHGMISMVTNGFGIEIDSDSVGMATTIIPSGEGSFEGEIGPDSSSWVASAKEQINKQIDQKVDALRPVLNESQISQYRQQLELKQGGIFGGLDGEFLQIEKVEDAIPKGE